MYFGDLKTAHTCPELIVITSRVSKRQRAAIKSGPTLDAMSRVLLAVRCETHRARKVRPCPGVGAERNVAFMVVQWSRFSSRFTIVDVRCLLMDRENNFFISLQGHTRASDPLSG